MVARMLLVLAAVALALPAAAEDRKATEEFEKLSEEFEKASDKFEKELAAAKTDADRKKVEENDPRPGYAEKFLTFAKKYRKEAVAFDALVAALGASGGPQNKEGCWARVLRAIERDHIERPQIGKLTRQLAGSGDEASVTLLKAIMEKNPDKKIQARACKAILGIHRERIDVSARLEKDPTLRASIEKERGKEYVARVLEEVAVSKKQVEALQKLLEGKYAEFVLDLSVGKMAPEAVSMDLAGKKVKLSDLKGKVVVLDFWATWCPPCRGMIPHTRKLVAKHKDAPFAFVSISGDDDKETLEAFLKKTPMPWTHWFNGPDGGLIDDWDIDGFPTIFVIDARGVIRFRDVRDEELDQAVAKLLKEIKK